MYKKGSKTKAITGPEALDVALCYGWITGQARRGTKDYALWRFCPRRKRSLWSKLNTQHAERLIREGRMREPGMKQISEAKSDRRWARAYAPQRTAVLPRDFIIEINRSRKAREFMKGLSRQNVYAIIFRLHHTMDKERRKEKIRKIVKMLEKGGRFH